MSSLVVSLFWLLLFVGGGIFLAYQRIDLRTSTIAAGFAVLAYTIFGEGAFLWKLLLWAAFGAMIVPNLIEFRREKITRPLLDVYRKMLPSMSNTEREALEAGNVWWEGELFSGMPNWDKLMSFPAPQLSDEEQAFLDGPVEELCAMLDDWQINHELDDLPEPVWQYLKDNNYSRAILASNFLQEVNSGNVSCLVDGVGHIVACVDSHRLVAGPLHKQTIRPVKAGERWVTLNLARYLGHRVHLEFVPAATRLSPTVSADRTSRSRECCP